MGISDLFDQKRKPTKPLNTMFCIKFYSFYIGYISIKGCYHVKTRTCLYNHVKIRLLVIHKWRHAILYNFWPPIVPLSISVVQTHLPSPCKAAKSFMRPQATLTFGQQAFCADRTLGCPRFIRRWAPCQRFFEQNKFQRPEEKESCLLQANAILAVFFLINKM